ncbi:MAG: molybdenum cofactor biosynthesis protein MoaE [Thaumarchaeota archaeon]|nr:molybdenum cofactor biosynthesis protein MoaE [Nitrososphaerota archaeon]
MPSRVLDEVMDVAAGGVALFLGTVRDHGEAGKVVELDYQSYVGLAERKLLEIEKEVLRKWPVKKIRIVHRIGRLRLGEVSVAVALSTPHRAEAFEACRYAIDRIKRDVPIWKRETLAGGKRIWVAGQTMGG